MQPPALHVQWSCGGMSWIISNLNESIWLKWMKFSIKTFQQFRLNFWTLHLGTGEGENIKFISISNGTVSAQNKRTETKDERFCFWLQKRISPANWNGKFSRGHGSDFKEQTSVAGRWSIATCKLISRSSRTASIYCRSTVHPPATGFSGIFCPHVDYSRRWWFLHKIVNT